MDLSKACMGVFCVYLFSFDICSVMCLSSKLIHLLINKVYAHLDIRYLSNHPSLL